MRIRTTSRRLRRPRHGFAAAHGTAPEWRAARQCARLGDCELALHADHLTARRPLARHERVSLGRASADHGTSTSRWLNEVCPSGTSCADLWRRYTAPGTTHKVQSCARCLAKNTRSPGAVSLATKVAIAAETWATVAPLTMSFRLPAGVIVALRLPKGLGVKRSRVRISSARHRAICGRARRAMSVSTAMCDAPTGAPTCAPGPTDAPANAKRPTREL